MAYPRSVVALLWPPPATARLVVTVGRAKAATDREWVVFPTPGTPRTLIPTGLPGAATMLERQQEDRRLSGRIARSAVGWATRSRLTGWLPLPRLRVTGAGESIETFLSAVLGEPVAVGVLLGTWRANRKPVLRIFDAGGDTLGFAKVGHNDLTRELVRREAENLRGVGAAPGGHLQTPELIHHQRWRGLEILVMSALTHPVAVEADFERLPLEAMHELSILGGTQISALATSGYVERLRAASSTSRTARARFDCRAAGQGLGAARQRRHRVRQLARRLGRLEHGLGRRPGPALGLGTLRTSCAARVRRTPLPDAERQTSARRRSRRGSGRPRCGPDLLEQVGVPAHLAASRPISPLPRTSLCALHGRRPGR